MFEVNSPEKIRQIREKDWFQQVEHMQVPNGTGPGVRRSKRPLSACYTRRKMFNGNLSQDGKKSQIGIKSDRWSVVIVLVRLQNVI